MSDSGWTDYGTGQTNLTSSQDAIEEMHQKYQKGINLSSFTLTFTRLDNKQTDNYKIDFESMSQINMRTRYIRKIQRVE